MYDGGIQAQARGNLADAVKQYSAALKNADDDATIVLTAGKLASVLDQSGKFAEARENYEHVLTLDKKLHGQKSAQVGNDFNNLGLVWQHEGNFTEAESYFKKSVEVFESSDTKIELAGVLTNLALLMQETARYDGVEPYLSAVYHCMKRRSRQLTSRSPGSLWCLLPIAGSLQ